MSGGGEIAEGHAPGELDRRFQSLGPAQRALLRARMERLDASRRVTASIPRRSAGSPCPVSFAQERIWVHQMLDPSSLAYNRPVCVRLAGPLRVEALREALQLLVARHDVLRASVSVDGAAPVLEVLPRLVLELTVSNVSDSANPESQADALLQGDAVRPVAVDRAPLIRARLVRLAAGEHWLILIIHHLVFDAWSESILIADLSELYRSAVSRMPPTLTPLPLDYSDFAAWDRSAERCVGLSEGRAYWRAMMESVPRLRLPGDATRVGTSSEDAVCRDFELSPALCEGLRDLSRREGTTVSCVLLTALAVLIHRDSGARDLVIGCPASGRTRVETERLMGLFINLLPLRFRFEAADAGRTLLGRVHQILLDGLRHQEVPLQWILEDVRARGGAMGTPLIRVMFIHERVAGAPPPVAGVTFGVCPVAPLGSSTDLTLEIFESADRITGRWVCRSELWAAADAAAMERRFLTLLQGLIAAPEASLESLPVADTSPDSCGPCLHERFERQALLAPGAIAVRFAGGELTYRELNERANRLARHLRRLGVGPDSPVVLLLERTPELVVGLLAILKAGGAYVPLDASCPPERVSRVLEDAAAPLLITSTRRVPASLSDATRLLLMDDLPVEAVSGDAGPLVPRSGPGHLAYIIYTSGSTGRPKGVAIEHRQLSAYLDWAVPLMGAGGCGAPVQSSVSFDLAVTSLWLPLVTGRTTFLVPEDNALEAFAGLVRQNMDFSLLKVTPSHLEALDELLGDADVSGAARCLVVGGEVFSPRLAARWRQRMPRARIFNEYGPTETTVGCTVHEVSDSELSGASLSIGREVPGSRLYVMGPEGLPVPDGQVGELWVGGMQVARGYWRHPDLTAERFVPNPRADASAPRLYRTGDRVRRHVNGTLEYLGRMDRQVKIRGYRVEPDEVEAVLLNCPAVREAAVEAVAAPDGSRELVAYIVPSADARATLASLHDFLTVQLPHYLVPARFIVLDRLPLTPNGKVDRGALDGLQGVSLTPDRASVLPRTPVESRIAELWKEVLHRTPIGIHDNFFTLGGNSLLALTLIAAVQRRFDRGLRLSDFLLDPTIAGMAAGVDETRAVSTAKPILRTTEPGVGLIPATGEQVNLWLTQQIIPDPSAYNVVYAARLKGLVDPALLEQALATVVGRQDILRTQFSLAGHEVLQEVVSWTQPRVDWEDLRAIPAGERESVLTQRLAAAARVLLDPGKAPLWRFRVLQMGDADHALVFTLHHVLVDEWSMHLLFSELELAYRGASGESVTFPELPVRFADFAVWQRARLEEADLAAHREYWRRSLQGWSGGMALPTDRPVAVRPTGRGGRLTASIPAATRHALQSLAQDEATSGFVVALAGWMAWLGRRTGERKILVGTPVAQRERPEVEFLAGLFLQTLPVRVTMDVRQDFRSFVRQVREQVSNAFAHSALPLAQILESIPRTPGALSPIPTGFVLVDRSWPELRLPGTTAEALPLHTATAKFDLLLSMSPGAGGGWSAELEYSEDRFSPERARQLLDEFARFLEVVSGRPNASGFGSVPEGSGSPSSPVLTSRSHVPDAVNLMNLLEEEWDFRRDRIAIEGRGESLNYDFLRQEYDRLASVLSARGVRPGVTVALCVERSAARIIGVLGIVKAGGACMPIDPSYPASRIASMMEDGRPTIIVSDGSHAALFRDCGIPILRIDALESEPTGPVPGRCPAGPEDSVYVLFTSGSTGRPKGVAMPHRALVNLIRWQVRTSVLKPGDRTLQFAPISFDVSFQEIFATLAQGGALVLITEEERMDPARLLEAIRSWRVNRLVLPFVALQYLAAEATQTGSIPSDLKEVFTSGEALRITPEIAGFFAGLSGFRFCNQYGPTETHVVSEFELSGSPSSWERMPPIGRAIDGVQWRVLDEDLREVAPGVEGELFIGGPCLSTGYQSRPDLTAERFVPDPTSPGARWYRTGDRVVERPDGNLEFRGRADGQVKVRGFRVELGEVEAALERHPAVGQAVATLRGGDPGNVRLVGYYVAADGNGAPVGTDVLRTHMAGLLPDYMVPSSFVVLSQWPRTPSGKIDRFALPAPVADPVAPGDLHPPPVTPLERQLAAIWREVLGLGSVGIHDNFFSLGGHSLLAMRVLSRLRSSLGCEISMRLLFNFPTIAGLSAQIEALQGPTAARASAASPSAGPSSGACIPSRFRAVMRRAPEAVALVSGPLRWTYGDLDRLSDGLALEMMAAGLRTGGRVGIHGDRSVEWVVAVLAVLKAGAAYVPLLPGWPGDRLRDMAEAAGVTLMVTASAEIPDWTPPGIRCVEGGLRVLRPRADGVSLPTELPPETPACVLFTSGSTGRPKGVLVPHRAIHRLVVGQDYAPFGPGLRCLYLSSPAFDASTFEVWAPLLNGGTCVVLSERQLDLDAMELAVRNGAVNCLFLTTGLFNHVIDSRPAMLSGVTDVLTGGEALSESYARRALELLPGVRLLNCYGPTETTTFATTQRIPPSAEWVPGGGVPIGRELAGTWCGILDETGHAVVPGEPGELFIGGDGVALGYVNDPELTAARFVPDPVDPSGRARWYRTGDRARRREDGALEFLGRLDAQVKIRGHRIEPAEIEGVLQEDSGVQQAIILARPAAGGGVLELVACVQSRAGSVPDIAELRRRIARRLPDYMMPSRFRVVDAIPLTPNGKVDRRALGLALDSEPADSMAGTLLSTPDEAVVASIWREVLNRRTVGLHDNFFLLGGHSMLAMKVVTRLRAAWSCPVPVRTLFDHPTVASLAAQRPRLNDVRPPVDSGTRTRDGGQRGTRPGEDAGSHPADAPAPPPVTWGEDVRPPLIRVPRDQPLQASSAQERLWFLDRLEPGSTAYLMPEALRFHGLLDVPALERALREIVQRHESLRTLFEDAGGFPRPVIRPVPDDILAQEDLSGLSPEAREGRVAVLLADASRHCMDLGTGPLFRFRLLRLAPEEHVFLRTIHHIVSDGWSCGVFNRELSVLYSAFTRGQPSPLPPLPFQCADFSAWQRRILDGPALERLLDHWTRRLAGAPPRLTLPADGAGPHSAGEGAGTCQLTLPAELAGAVGGLAQSASATPFMLLLAAFNVLMGRLSGQEDIVIGTPIAGRNHVASESLIGFFISTIALRTDLSGCPTFRELVERVRDTVLDAQDHQELPFEKLIERLHPDRTARHHPVFQVLFNLINFEDELPTLEGIQARREAVSMPDPKFDLTVYVVFRPGVLTLRASYPPHRFLRATVERMLGQFRQLLEEFVRNPESSILAPSLVLPQDRTVLPAPEAPLERGDQPAIHEAFETQARRNPRRLAVRDPESEWSYGDLNAAADRLANQLVQSGVGRGETVAVYAVPSGTLVVAVLGIFKAGARMLVLDAAQPEARLRRMLDQARPGTVLTLDAAGDLPPQLLKFVRELEPRRVMAFPSGMPSEVRGEPSLPPIAGADPAYLVFTSGSTGEPLGILGDHGPVSHFLRWHRDRFLLTENDRFSLLSGPGHDPMLRDVFAPLSIGASLHIPPPEVRRSYDQMQAWFEREGITISHLTPALAQILSGAELISGPRLHCLRWMFLGGDRLTGPLVRALRERAPDAGMVNFYGTTETPQVMAYHVAVPPGQREPVVDAQGTVPLGRPIRDVQLLLLNGANQLAGIGELAEIAVRTPHLSRGYLGADAVQQSRYGTNPYTGHGSDRLYRTGDLGRYLPDGTVVFVGRRDGQIKVRGYRIEPDEIHRALRRHPAVRECMVMADVGPDAEVSLRAFVVLRDPQAPPSRSEIRSLLKGALPEAVIPSRFLVVPALPLTPNGKVDRRALDQMTLIELPVERREVEPRTGEEREMLAVWREALGRPTAGIHDNFFDLGGHSLLALRLVTMLHQQLRIPIVLADLFAHPTVAELAALGTSTSRATEEGRGFRGEGTGAPWFHVPGVFGFEFLTPALARLIGSHRRYHDGLQYPGLDGRREPATTVEAIAADLVRQIGVLHPDGPVWVSGYSMGGMVAIEVARQLAEAGRAVERVVLFDSRLMRNARRTSRGQQIRILTQRFRELPGWRRWAWLRGLVLKKLEQHPRRLARRLGLGPRDLQERMEMAGWAASAAHTPRSYSGPVTLLRSTRLGEFDSAAWERDPLNGWGPYLPAGFEICNLDCDHERIFLEPVHPGVLAVVEAMLTVPR